MSCKQMSSLNLLNNNKNFMHNPFCKALINHIGDSVLSETLIINLTKPSSWPRLGGSHL